jgi:hypothetical protein
MQPTMQKLFPGLYPGPPFKREEEIVAKKWKEGKGAEGEINENPLSKCGYSLCPRFAE